MARRGKKSNRQACGRNCPSSTTNAGQSAPAQQQQSATMATPSTASSASTPPFPPRHDPEEIRQAFARARAWLDERARAQRRRDHTGIPSINFSPPLHAIPQPVPPMILAPPPPVLPQHPAMAQFGQHENIEPVSRLLSYPGPVLLPPGYLDPLPAPVPALLATDHPNPFVAVNRWLDTLARQRAEKEQQQQQQEDEDAEMADAPADFNGSYDDAFDPPLPPPSPPSSPRPATPGTSRLNPYATAPLPPLQKRSKKEDMSMVQRLLVQKTELLWKLHNLPARFRQPDGSLSMSIGWFGQELEDYFNWVGAGRPMLRKNTWLYKDREPLGLDYAFVAWLAGDVPGSRFRLASGSIFRS